MVNLLNLEASLPKIKLKTSEIHLWCAFPDEIKDPDLLSKYRNILSHEEKKQWSRFYFDKHKHLYLVTRGLVRSVLSLYHPIAPKDWLFTKNEYGRPQAIQQPKNHKIRFNLSNTRGLIICGVILNNDLGVDVEEINKDLPYLEMAKHSFSDLEVNELMKLSPEQKKKRFFDYWTLKESFIKARGMGLSLPLNEFSFHFEPKKHVKISFASQKDDPKFWNFWQLQLSDNHLAAIAVKNKENKNYQLIIKKIIPLKGKPLSMPHLIY